MKPLKDLILPCATAYIALDVETANFNRGSICQIGLAAFSETELLDSWGDYIDPEEYFSGQNIAIHGITESMVFNCSKFADILPELCKLEKSIVAQHSGFDSGAIKEACAKYGLPVPNLVWVDSAKIARRTWPKGTFNGYGLGELSLRLGITFQHHDAIEDAIAAGKVVLAALDSTGTKITDWVIDQNKPVPSFFR
ncbi:MAG: 3'-5' exonuclease [SAR324 cluster bacterium]|nr:3'-5' exonuclease [SAR324 cluster bacterium]